MDNIFQSSTGGNTVFSNADIEKMLNQLSSSFQDEKIKNAIDASNEYTLEQIKKTNLLKSQIWDKILYTNSKLQKSYDVFDSVSEKLSSDALNAEETRKEANQQIDRRQEEIKKKIEDTNSKLKKSYDVFDNVSEKLSSNALNAEENRQQIDKRQKEIMDKVSSSVGLGKDKLENNKTVEGSLLPTIAGIAALAIGWEGLKFATKKIKNVGMKTVKAVPEIAAVGYLAALPASAYIDKKYGTNLNEKINPKRSDFGFDMMLSDELKYVYSAIEAVKAPFRYKNEIYKKLNLDKSFKNLKTVLANAKLDLKTEGLLEHMRYERWVNKAKSIASNIKFPKLGVITKTSQFLSSVSNSISSMGNSITKAVPILQTAIQRTLPSLRTAALVSTGFLKMVGKRLPLIGAIWNGVEAAVYAWQGDWYAAGLKLLEATVVQTLWLVPYVGWAASLGLSLIIDNMVAKHREDMKKAKAIAEDTQSNIVKEKKQEIEKLKGVSISKEGKVEIPENATPLTEEDKMNYKGTIYKDPVTKKEYFVTDDKTGSIPPPAPIYYDPEKKALGKTIKFKSDYDKKDYLTLTEKESPNLNYVPKEEKWLTLPTIPQTPPPIPLPTSIKNDAEMPKAPSTITLDDESIKKIKDSSSSEGQGSVININGSQGGGSGVKHLHSKSVEDYRRNIRTLY